MRKSIKKKINHLLGISLVILTFFMVIINFIVIYRNTTRNSEIIMSKSCSSLALELNDQFKLVEQSVSNLYDISEQFRPDIEQLKDQKTVDNYLKQFKSAAITIADNTEGALAIYFRMNPDLTNSGTSGFFYVKSNTTGKFENSEITDLLAYEVDDIEHVGWYYAPVWAGKAVWQEPYYNANINVEMISYVVPIYDRSNLVGVVGIDIDFNQIKAIAEDLNIYDSCGAVLCSMTNSAIYYNNCDLFGEAIPSDLYTALLGKESSEDIFTYKVKEEKYGLYFKTLNNRMKLLIYANVNDIYSQERVTIFISIVVFLIVFGITFLLALNVSNRIVKPITDITEATKKYADGQWDVKVSCDTEDELQLLTENISIMADKTKEYIDYIQDMANKDALTRLRNKTAYMLYVDRIKQDYLPIEKSFSVVVFDVNNLKKVNDEYGHEKGDELIVSASKIICKYFSHSPVFRIGGDEFVSIVDGADYDNRNDIIAEFQNYMRLSKGSKNIMDVCVACGIADYGEDGTSFEAVFAVADQRMYDNKVDLKDGEKPR